LALDGNLRQQNPSVALSNHEQPVLPDNDRFGLDALEWRQHANLNLQVWDFRSGYRWKSRIVKGGIDRCSRDDLSERAGIFNLAHAPSQLSVAVQADKGAAMLV
jgi:hypothetical protein